MSAVATGPAVLRGRPRDAGVDEAVHAACVAILATGGPGAFTIRAVAAAAGVGAATIYRRWSGRDVLLTETVIRLMEESIPTELDAAIEDGVLALTRGWVHALVATPVGRALPIIVELAAHQPRVAEAVAAWHLDRRVRVNAMLQRAMDAGDLRPDVDLGIAVDLLGGPTFYRRVFVSLDIQAPDYAVRLAREFLRWAGWTGDLARVGAAS
ncbi:TetR-like C-terminal domain-containing protein [Curtobacterium sp. DN_7.5]|uniref:TetR-like C-terminal domain-containing protein n=1 Tax=Curtobacterium sp. DN_7.5 TaxID=3049047 RepID=UPI001F58F633|nr:TetR-like C-terminal domain-containing protein [Curtobacterium sp. DN_7.5]